MNFEKAKQFIYRNARPLDLVRWQYLFENGSKEDVLKILASYQNEDGGFGHGLESDSWNPNSTPVQTWAATEIIREIDLNDSDHPIIQKILKYLSSKDAFNGHIWLNTVSSNNLYPHAPWWHDTSTPKITYNPTASLIGFIIHYADKESELYARAISLAKEAYTYFKMNFPLDSMHTVACFVELYEDLKESDISIIHLDEYEELLQRQIKYLLTSDPELWAREYVCKPSLFIHSKNSTFYSKNQEVCTLECAFIDKTQQEDGTWEITWKWNEYPEQWNITKNWWKADQIIKNIKFYQTMN